MSEDKIPIREHLEAVSHERVQRFEGLWVAHEAVHRQEEVARNESAKRMDARLEQLNELRAEVITDRGRLVSREEFAAEIKALSVRIDGLHDQITEWKGRGKGLSLMASIVVGGVGFVATVLAIYFALNG